MLYSDESSSEESPDDKWFTMLLIREGVLCSPPLQVEIHNIDDTKG